MILFIKYLLFSAIIWGIGIAFLLIIPEWLWTPYIGLLIVISNIHWILYSVNKDKKKRKTGRS